MIPFAVGLARAFEHLAEVGSNFRRWIIVHDTTDDRNCVDKIFGSWIYVSFRPANLSSKDCFRGHDYVDIRRLLSAIDHILACLALVFFLSSSTCVSVTISRVLLA